MKEKEETPKSCFNCGSTSHIKKFKGKWICEKCAFWYDTHDDAQPHISSPKLSHHHPKDTHRQQFAPL